MSEATAPHPAPEGDARLLRRVAEGDRAALAELVEQHQGAVFRFARTLLPDEASALSQLGDEDREILALRDMEGLSGPETAEVLGLGLAAMKSRLHRARLRFAAALRPEVSHDG